jgi:hypothetical protein
MTEAVPVSSRIPSILALAMGSVLLGWNLLEHFSIADDAYISFRYLDHFLAGDGLVWNVGERVEGYTNFLWIRLLAPLRLLGLTPESASIFLGLLCLVLVAVFRTADALGGRAAAFAACLFAAGSLPWCVGPSPVWRPPSLPQWSPSPTPSWLAQRFPKDSLLAINAAGVVPYRTGFPSLDMLGLNDRHIARSQVVPAFGGRVFVGHYKHDGGYVCSRAPDLVLTSVARLFSGRSAQGDYPGGEQHISRRSWILARHPDIREALYGLALSLEQLNRKSDAIAAWKRYLTQARPGSTWADRAKRHLALLGADQ